MTGRQISAWALMAALAALLTLPEPAQAFSRKVQRACKGDYKRLCPHYKPNTPQMRACMESKSSDLSGVCINALIDDGIVDRRQVRR
jgi:hypothetical protein